MAPGSARYRTSRRPNPPPAPLRRSAARAPLLQSLVDSLTPLVFAERVSLVRALLCLTFPVFCMKQLFSVLQGATALRRVLAMDDAARS